MAYAIEGLRLLDTLGLNISWESNFMGRWPAEHAQHDNDVLATTAALYSHPPHRHGPWRAEEFAYALQKHESELVAQGFRASDAGTLASKLLRDAHREEARRAREFEREADELYHALVQLVRE